MTAKEWLHFAGLMIFLVILPGLVHLL